MAKPSVPLSAIVTRVTILGLGLALFFEKAGARQLLHLDPGGGPMMHSPAYWISLLAPIFFLAALWAASNVFVRMQRGDAFGAAMVRGLREIGGCLMLGAFAAIVAEPSLTYLIGNDFREMRGARFDLDVQNVTLALVGLMLVLLARQGRGLKAKLDQFV